MQRVVSQTLAVKLKYEGIISRLVQDETCKEAAVKAIREASD